MSMHMERPRLTTTGKKKGKQKFKSAEAKREHERLAKEWEQLKMNHETKPAKRVFKQWTYSLSSGSRDTGPRAASRGTGIGNGLAKETHQYTGDKMIGVAIQHKSCLQPVFSEAAAKESASMRR